MYAHNKEAVKAAPACNSSQMHFEFRKFAF